MISFDDITACLVTRGNVPMQPILNTLPYKHVSIWDNSLLDNYRTFGRYCCFTPTDYIYFQDDDVIFTEHDKLLEEFNATPELLVTNDGHGGNYAGYEDLAWCCAGAIVHRDLVRTTWRKWFEAHPKSLDDEEFRYEADAVFGILTPFRHIELPYERLYVDDDTRLCRQPWQENLKLEYATMARKIRDKEVASG